MSQESVSDKFRVFVFYPNETYFEPEDSKQYPAQEAVAKAEEMIVKAKDERGEYQTIRITDSDDYCCFEWQKGKGIVFPPPPSI